MVVSDAGILLMVGVFSFAPVPVLMELLDFVELLDPVKLPGLVELSETLRCDDVPVFVAFAFGDACLRRMGFGNRSGGSV